MFLGELGRGDTGICDNRLVVTVDVGWAINRDTKHSQFVSQCFDHINCNPCSNKFTSKCGRLNSILAFAVPNNWCLVTKEKNPSLGTTGESVRGMIGINKTLCYYRFSTGFRHVGRQLLLCIRIELLPVDLFKQGVADLGFVRAHLNEDLGPLFEISKDMIGSIKVSLARQCQMRCERGYFIGNVNPAQFNGPSQDAEELLIVIGILGAELIRHVHFRSVLVRED